MAMNEEEFNVKRNQSIAAFVLAIIGLELAFIPLLLTGLAYYLLFDNATDIALRVTVILGLCAILACPIVALYLISQCRDINKRPFTIFNRLSKIFSIISLAILGFGVLMCFVEIVSY